MKTQDPFYLVREEIQDSVKEVQNNFTRWDRLPRGNQEKTRLAEECFAQVDSIVWQLDELDHAINTAEKNYERFQIEPEELKSRRRWTQQTRSQVNLVTASIKEFNRTHQYEASQSRAASKTSTVEGRLENAIQQENDSFIGNQGNEQEMLMRTQDAELDELTQSVTRLGQVGLTISEELTDQGRLLDELDEDMDGTSTRLNAIQRKLTVVIKKSGVCGQIIMIVFLVIVLVILVGVLFS